MNPNNKAVSLLDFFRKADKVVEKIVQTAAGR